MKRITWFLSILLGFVVVALNAQDTPPASTGLGMGMGSLSRLSHAKTRSISAENMTGEKGKGGMATKGAGAQAARELGQTWKISPAVDIQAKQVFTLAEIQGPGAIQHIWVTPSGDWRFSILRMYWDGESQPSVEVPVGDFFANGWGKFAPVASLAVCVNPGSGFNSYWEMPFRKSARITMENLDEKPMTLFYQVDYTLTEVPLDAAYFHAQFRRSNPLPCKTDHVILDGVKGWGQYVGTYLAWGSHSRGWWGEGEIKFFLDGDSKFPTINGTGTEDYFCGSYGFENPTTHQYQEFTSPYSGMPQVIRPDGLDESQQRFGLYRWHIMDPIRFEQDLKVTIQALGWRSGGRYLPLQDDISSVGFWYQTEPHAPFPKFPDKDTLEVK
ncbi:MAG: glycoside hydrolase family 172 protein [Terriglobia bacterium]